jgi:hypothetical protein
MSYRVAGHTLTPLWMLFAAVIAAASIVLASISGSSGWWVAAGLIGPDLAFLLAIGVPNTTPGRMPARVIPVYNALHRPVGPIVLGVVSLALVAIPSASATVGVVALSWLAHIVWDRSVGYGLRDREGAIIPVS